MRHAREVSYRVWGARLGLIPGAVATMALILLFWTSRILPGEQRTAPPIALRGGGLLRYSTADQKTRLDITIPRHDGTSVTESLLLARDDTVTVNAPVARLRVVGEMNSSIVILSDAYASKVGGLAYCQAGTETFLRVISLGGSSPDERLRLKTESCWASIELSDAGIQWEPSTQMLKVHWLRGPQRRAETRTYHIAEDGSVTAGITK